MDTIQHSRLRPYESYNEYLSDELLKLDLLLQSVLDISSCDRTDEEIFSPDMYLPKEYIQGLFVDSIIDSKSKKEFRLSIEQKSSEINERLSVTEDISKLFPSEKIKRLFSLKPTEYQALLIALAPVIDSKYEKIYAYINNSMAMKYPTVQLLYNMSYENPEEISAISYMFSMGAPLVSWNLLHLTTDVQYAGASRYFTLDPRIADFLLENISIDTSLSTFIRFISDFPGENGKTDANDDSVHSLTKYLISRPVQTPFILCSGESTKAKIKTARKITKALGCSLMYVPIGDINHSKSNEVIMRMVREAILFETSIFLDFGIENENVCNDYLRLYSEACESLHLPVFFGVAEKWNRKLVNIARFFELKFKTPSRAVRNELWQEYIHGNIPANGTSIDYLVDQFKFSEEQIENAVQVALRNSILSGNKKLTPDDILVGCRSQTDHNLKTMGVKLEFKFNLDDIVLPQDRIEHLQEIVNQYKHRTQVLETWGFNSKVAYGNGLTVLFSGPSGTGKTMAASVIARELKLDIYKIDLSSVVSKYIGETEKNLSRIFDEAAISNAILFFDEADALFGKRTEVKDSHDRHANLETSFLLQKMEEYEGITVLASNIRQNMDSAFLRRINFIIEFPFPDGNLRAKLWQKIFPKRAPLDTDLDFTFLSNKMELTGGNIKNIALAAAYNASASGDNITMTHLIKAAKREIEKMGKPFIVSEYLPHSDFLNKNKTGVR